MERPDKQTKNPGGKNPGGKNPGGKNPEKRNARLALVLSGVVFGMVGLSFAAVPLYDLFCRVTGIGGTTQVAEAMPDGMAERVMRIRFNADTNQRLPWSFGPQEREQSLQVGEPGLVFYEAKNLAARPTVGTAVYNVTPFKAGRYFHKVQCFCFEEQKLAPGEEMQMGVSFYVDPAILDDPDLDDVHTITLSYTFFRDLDDWDAERQEREQISHVTDPGDSRVTQQ